MASIGIPFACGRDTNDTSFCLNPDAICIRNDPTIGEICVCPEGYTHDLVAGHFANCAMPSWYLPAVFAVQTVGCAWALFLIVPEILFRLRSTLRKAMIFYCLAVVCIWLHVLCIFLQGGNFEVAVVFLVLLGPSLIYFAYLMFRIVIDPVTATIGEDKVRLRRDLSVFCFVFYTVALTFVQLAMIAYANPSSLEATDTFNLLFALQSLIMAAAYPTSTVACLWQLRQLMSIIQSLLDNTHAADTGTEQLETFLRQLNNLRKFAICMTFNFFPLFIPAVFVFTIGSLPYQFVFWTINMFGLWPAAYTLKQSIRKNQRKEQQVATVSLVPSMNSKPTPPDVETVGGGNPQANVG